MIGGGEAAGIVVDAAFIVSGDRGGAILAIVDDASAIDGTVPLKDRYDLRDDVDPLAMRPETKLHHLIDAKDIDDVTLARLALLDGATIVDRDGRLLAYGAIVDSADSEHEGARTAAAKSLSKTAMVVLKVSADGDITVFRDGRVVATLLGPPPL
nr:diadenylate cyclase [Rhabdothermincola salaria]